MNGGEVAIVFPPTMSEIVCSLGSTSIGLPIVSTNPTSHRKMRSLSGNPTSAPRHVLPCQSVRTLLATGLLKTIAYTHPARSFSRARGRTNSGWASADVTLDARITAKRVLFSTMSCLRHLVMCLFGDNLTTLQYV